MNNSHLDDHLSRLRGLPLARILASINRGMRALGETMERRGFRYLLPISGLVTLAGRPV